MEMGLLKFGEMDISRVKPSSMRMQKPWPSFNVDKEWGGQDMMDDSVSDIREPVLSSNQKFTFALSCTDPVLFVEFAPFDWCSELICIVFEERVVIGQLKKQDNGGDGKYINYLRKFIHSHGSPTCLCWNPATLSHAESSKVYLSVCLGCRDHKLRVFSSNLGEQNHDVKVLEGHTNFINTAMYHPEGHILATGSDDFTCRIWNVKNDYNCQAVLNMHTMVMSVRFTSQCPDSFVVALKNGKMHLISLESKRPLKTFYCEDEPLLMADWALDCRNYLVTVIGDDLMWWDIFGPESSSSFPLEKRSTLLLRGQYVCFAPWNHRIVATFGGPEPDYRIKVFSLTELKEPLFSTAVKWRPWNMSWHKHLPLLCAGVGNRLCFWDLSHLRMLDE